MNTETMVGVADVEKSSAWYQHLLGCRSNHGGSEFDRIVNAEGEVVILLHKLGFDDHPSLGSEGEGPLGRGVEIYFRTADVESVYQRAREVNADIEIDLRFNPLAHQDEFKLRDPDGYLITICGPPR
jgi:catechol 2,3-dioxygenase-like lactoylglutathione lyase family enzyme